ncbi:hypothetical protein, partial [Shewanella sp. SG41-4]|uniref:hypothetical protein n=1 Tax=Shewanella sp. SG41-4 TaxID=2760976 RepID=UPI001C7196DB
EEWYARLEQFLQSDAVNNDGKLRMDNIIQQARYLTKKIGEVIFGLGEITNVLRTDSVYFSNYI